MTLLATKSDSQNISYTLYQVGADKFAIVVRDEDANVLIVRYNGSEKVIRAKYSDVCTKAGI